MHWNRYNRELANRGSLKVYISDDIAAKWAEPKATRLTPGRPVVYPDPVILLGLLLQQIYRLPLRQTMGLMRSVFELGRIALPVPDYSTLCRRRQDLVLPAWPKAGACIVIDSTGLQIRGPNTWLTTVHGHKRRTYRKIHLGVDPDSSLIVAGVVTPCQTHDSEALEAVLETADLQESAGSDWRWRLRPAPMLCRGQETRSATHYSTSDSRCPTWRPGVVRT